MAETAIEFFQADRIADAIAAQNAEVKSNPTDAGRRWFLAELLCIAGDLERADRQLDLISNQQPSMAVTAAQFRQLVRAEQARHQFHTEGRVPEFIDQPPPYLQHHLEASIALREGDGETASRLLVEADAGRPRIAGERDGTGFSDMRDIDDLTACFFEVLTATGKYYWIPMERLEQVEFHAPERPRDLIWRRANMVVRDGPNGEVYVPAIYVPPTPEVEDQARIGRITEWVGGGDAPLRGVGQRCFLIDDEEVAIMEIGHIEAAE